MSVKQFALHLYVSDLLRSGPWYEKILNARATDIQEYGRDCRFIEIRYGIFSIILDERPRHAEQNISLCNRFMQLDIEVTRDLVERLERLQIPIDEDYLSDDQDARYIKLLDPDENILNLSCYSDFRKRLRPVSGLRAARY